MNWIGVLENGQLVYWRMVDWRMVDWCIGDLSNSYVYMQHFQKEMKQLSPTLAETMIERAFTIKLSSKKMKKSVVIVCVITFCPCCCYCCTDWRRSMFIGERSKDRRRVK